MSSLPGTPTSTRKPRHGDRFIPTRIGNTWEFDFPLTPPTSISGASGSEGGKQEPLSSCSSGNRKRRDSNRDTDEKKGSTDGLYSRLLQNEMLGYQLEDCGSTLATPEKERVGVKRKLFHYDSSERLNIINSPWSQYSISPISKQSETLIQRYAKKPTRRIPKTPFKVLDAPELKDDFYLNLLDWSAQNCLGVGLGSCVYLWSACNSQVTRLCDLSEMNDSVTSVGWNEKGNLVAVGTHNGLVQVWDTTSEKKIYTLNSHSARVGSLAWNGDILTSGSKDQHIHQKDIRVKMGTAAIPDRKLEAHHQEVCGLKWSLDKQMLASGGNDNRLMIWDLRTTAPVWTFTEHQAAVKAIGWSPHSHGILASGGGTADKCIRFWNTVTGQPMQMINTDSQVCNLAWSKHSNEFVTTHGYSQNQIRIWKYPSLQSICELKGHTNRVLYLSMSPDGENIVTGAGDETLRFWSVFKKRRSQKENTHSPLNFFTRL